MAVLSRRGRLAGPSLSVLALALFFSGPLAPLSDDIGLGGHDALAGPSAQGAANGQGHGNGNANGHGNGGGQGNGVGGQAAGVNGGQDGQFGLSKRNETGRANAAAHKEEKALSRESRNALKDALKDMPGRMHALMASDRAKEIQLGRDSAVGLGASYEEALAQLATAELGGEEEGYDEALLAAIDSLAKLSNWGVREEWNEEDLREVNDALLGDSVERVDESMIEDEILNGREAVEAEEGEGEGEEEGTEAIAGVIEIENGETNQGLGQGTAGEGDGEPAPEEGEEGAVN